jgi:uncharacterized membrane protein YoaK (UPF0700 family)
VLPKETAESANHYPPRRCDEHGDSMIARAGGRVTAVTVRFDAVLAAVGGSLDAYTYLKRGGVFATAQTGNAVLLAVGLGQRDFALAVQKLPPIGAFALGVITSETIKRPRVSRAVHRPARFAVALEMLILVAVGALPGSVPNGIVVSTAMTTGNLVSALRATYAALADRDTDKARRAADYGRVILGFFSGALAGAVLSTQFGLRAAWFSAGLLLVALVLFVLDERPNRRRSGLSQDPRPVA